MGRTSMRMSWRACRKMRRRKRAMASQSWIGKTRMERMRMRMRRSKHARGLAGDRLTITQNVSYCTYMLSLHCYQRRDCNMCAVAAAQIAHFATHSALHARGLLFFCLQVVSFLAVMDQMIVIGLVIKM